jgi:hypothetical protein
MVDQARPNTEARDRRSVERRLVALERRAVPAGAMWQPHTPTLAAVTTDPTMGTDAALLSEWSDMGGMIAWSGQIVFGTAGVAAGSGEYGIVPPVPIHPVSPMCTGGIRLVDSSAAVVLDAQPVGGLLLPTGFGWLQARWSAVAPAGAARVWSSTIPWTWAANDSIEWFVTYRPAT